ncbi:MAG TPA: 3-oxoacyl-[acyl-carrier-protein] synthase III C-terminal domain-containing protein [Oculatellaceae cyanobacterium]|jgi:3-oxoacyl-[acyl-carrier-protein] synthase-3
MNANSFPISSYPSIGIAALGYYIPSGVMTSREIAQLGNLPVEVLTEKIGMEQKAVADSNEHPSDMGIYAARIAINQAGISPEQINIIAYCSAGDYDYRFWSPAAKIQAELGATNAFAFEVRNFCNSGNLGIHLCRNMLHDPDLTYALVICSDKLSSLVNYSDPNATSLFLFADGAAAAILKKNELTNQILSYHAVTEGQLADFVKIPLGGTKLPFFASQYEDSTLNYIQIADPVELNNIFSKTYLKNYVNVIETALSKSGYGIKDLNFVLTNQVKKSLCKYILSNLGLKDTQTFVSLKEYGHLGASDTFLGLAKLLELKQIQPGNIVVLASSAAGFSWGALVLKFQG